MELIFLILSSLCLLLKSQPSDGYRKEKEFFDKAGFHSLSNLFEEEEIEIHHILKLDNNTLRLLGVTTIGARMRIRESAEEWMLEHQRAEEVGVPVGVPVDIGGGVAHVLSDGIIHPIEVSH